MSRGGWLLLAGLALPAGAEPVRFSDALYEKFHHDRCLQCHQFNSRKSNGRAWTSHRSRYMCDTCHKPSLTGLTGGEWMAPANDKMDYTGLSARDTCQMMLRNAPTGDKKQVIRHHLLEDGRVGWALRNGKTPAGQRPIVPGGYDEWARDVNAWIDGGMRCD